MISSWSFVCWYRNIERSPARINACRFLHLFKELSLVTLMSVKNQVKLSYQADLLRIPSNIERPATRINAYLPSSGGSAIECAATAYLAFSKRSSLVFTFVCGRHTLEHWASCGPNDLWKCCVKLIKKKKWWWFWSCSRCCLHLESTSCSRLTVTTA